MDPIVREIYLYWGLKSDVSNFGIVEGYKIVFYYDDLVKFKIEPRKTLQIYLNEKANE